MLRCVSPLLFVLPLAAQATHFVGQGSTFADIDAAIAAASPGDRILVAAGTYPSFTMNKGVVVRADPIGASVIIDTPSVPVVCSIPPGESGHLEALDLRSSVAVNRPAGQTSAGTVTMTSVTCSQHLDAAGTAVVLNDCTFVGTVGPGVRLSGAVATLRNCTIDGGFVNGWFATVSPGLQALGNSSVLASGCTITGGGFSGHFSHASASGVHLQGNAKGWFVDSVIRAGQVSVVVPAVPGLMNQSSQAVVLERTATMNSLNFGAVPSGLAVNGLLLGVAAPLPLVRGGTYRLDYRTRPNLVVGVHARLGIDPPFFQPFCAQPDWGFVSSSVSVALLAAGPSGQVSVSLPIPNAPWAQDLPLWFEAWTGSGVPVQLAPVVGGLIR